MSQSMDDAIIKKIATTLVVLHTTPTPLGVPESALYLAVCDANLDEWNTLKAMLIQGELITVKFNAVSLTPKGAALATKINTALDAAKANALGRSTNS